MRTHRVQYTQGLPSAVGLEDVMLVAAASDAGPAIGVGVVAVVAAVVN